MKVFLQQVTNLYLILKVIVRSIVSYLYEVKFVDTVTKVGAFKNS